MLAERHGGLRSLARAMAGEHRSDYEPTVRRWLALAQSKPRSIADLNPIVARLAKFSRAEVRKLRRRIRTEPGPAGHRQAILAYISLGAGKPVVLTPEETLAFPFLPILAEPLVALVAVVRNITDRIRATLSTVLNLP
jgi:hypothetical protein